MPPRGGSLSLGFLDVFSTPLHCVKCGWAHGQKYMCKLPCPSRGGSLSPGFLHVFSTFSEYAKWGGLMVTSMNAHQCLFSPPGLLVFHPDDLGKRELWVVVSRTHVCIYRCAPQGQLPVSGLPAYLLNLLGMQEMWVGSWEQVRIYCHAHQWWFPLWASCISPHCYG
jgi:hypothetical protein